MNIQSAPGEIIKEFLGTHPLAGPVIAEPNSNRDVFSVHAAGSTASGQTGIVRVINSKTATLRYTRLHLRAMLSNAYDISECCIEISAALPEHRFDFLVQVPKASEAIMKPLLRQAIKSVYGAQVRRVKREKQVMLLRCDKCAPQPGLSPAPAIGACSDGREQFRSTGVTMATLARALEGKLGMPVLDETGLPGIYAVKLDWMGASRELLAATLKDQLGMTLTPADRTVATLEAFAAEKIL